MAMQDFDGNVRRVQGVSKPDLTNILQLKMIGLEATTYNIGAKFASGDMKWYVPTGGDADYNSLVLSGFSTTGALHVDMSGNVYVGTSNGGISIVSDWKYSIDTADTDPTSGYFKFNNTDIHLATQLNISITDNNGIDRTDIISHLAINDELYFNDVNDANSYYFFTVTSLPVVASGYATVDVSVLQYGSVTFPNDGLIKTHYMFKGEDLTLNQVTTNGSVSSNKISYATQPTSFTDLELVTKKYVTDNGGTQDLENVTSVGAVTKNPIQVTKTTPSSGSEGSFVRGEEVSIENTSGQYMAKIKSDVSGSEGVIELWSSGNGCEIRAHDTALNLSTGGAKGIIMGRPHSEMTSAQIDADTNEKVLITREYADNKYAINAYGKYNDITNLTNGIIATGNDKGKLFIKQSGTTEYTLSLTDTDWVVGDWIDLTDITDTTIRVIATTGTIIGNTSNITKNSGTVRITYNGSDVWTKSQVDIGSSSGVINFVSTFSELKNAVNSVDGGSSIYALKEITIPDGETLSPGGDIRIFGSTIAGDSWTLSNHNIFFYCVYHNWSTATITLTQSYSGVYFRELHTATSFTVTGGHGGFYEIRRGTTSGTISGLVKQYWDNTNDSSGGGGISDGTGIQFGDGSGGFLNSEISVNVESTLIRLDTSKTLSIDSDDVYMPSNNILLGISSPTHTLLAIDSDNNKAFIVNYSIAQINATGNNSLVTKEYVDAQGGGGSKWQDDATTLKPITDKDHLLLGGTPISGVAVGKLEINVPIPVAGHAVDISGADSGWDGTYVEESVSRYKMDNTHWIEDTGWYWIVCSDPNDAWNTGMYQGAGGNSTPSSVTAYSPINSATASPMVIPSGTSTLIEAITTDGKIYSSETIKTSKALQVGGGIAILTETNGVNTFGMTDVNNTGVGLDFNLEASVGVFESLMQLNVDGTAKLPNCDISEITENDDIPTKEYVDKGAYKVKTLANATGALVGDRTNGDYQRFTLTGDVTLSNPSNMDIGQQISFEFRQGATGHTVTRGTTELLAVKPNSVHLITVVKVTSTTFVFTPATEVVQ